MIAGRLEVEMVANLARLSSDLRQGTTMLEGWGRDANRIISSVGSAFAALGVGISAIGFSALIKSSIDTMDRLNDLSKATKIAVDDLAGLSVAAKKSGTDLDGAAGAINKLSQNIGKDAEKFRALGITAKEPLEAFKQLADMYVALEDPQQRAAVMAEALGKSWQATAPLLSEGGKRIGEMVEKGKEAAGITQEMAERADELNDKWIDIVGSGGMVNRMVGELTPLLIKLADEFLRSREEAKKLGSDFSPLLETGKAITVLFSEVVFVFKMVGHEIGMVAAQFEKLLVARDAFLRGDFRAAALALLQFKDIGEEGNRVAVEARRTHDAWVESIMRLGTAANGAGKDIASLAAAQAGAFGDQASRRAASEAAAAARAFLNTTKHAKETTKEIKAAGDATQHWLDWLKEVERVLAHLAALNKLDQDAIEARGRAAEELANDWAEGTEALELELRLMGLSNVERRKAILIEKARLDLIAAGNNEMLRRDINQNLADQLALLDQIDGRLKDTAAIRTQASAWNELGDIVGDFFADLVMNGKSAFDNLKRMVKSLLAEMIALFAKRWIFNMVGMGGMAGQAGAGTLAGSLLNAGTSWLGSTVIGAGASAFGAGFASTWGMGAGMVGPTMAGAGGLAGFGAAAGSFATSVASAIAAIPVWGWIAAGLLAVAAAFIKNDDKWRATLGFGANAQVYSTDGVFGREGFLSIEGNDAVNRAIQDFMASTRPLDETIARHLTPEQIAQITASLGIYNQRTDGQAAEFAFDRGEEGAAEQLTLEYLKHKYGTIFDTIDSTFAEFIRDYTGKTEDLLREIGAFVTMMEQLSATGMPGLDIAALRAMQRNGEQIGDTFQRIGAQWQTFTDLFTTDAERLAMAQEAIAETFHDLGMEIPGTKDEFEALVRGLDLTTASGRAAFQALLEIAPAFAAVADAAAEAANAALERWQRVEGLIRRRNGVTDFDHAVSQFQAGNPWAAGLSPQQLVQALLTITRPDFDRYTAANQDLIESILGLDDATEDAADAITRMGNSARGVFDPRPGVDGDAWRAGRAGVGSWLDSLLIGGSSPLSPMDQLAEAERQFRAAVAGGNGDLIRSTGQAWIDLGREFHRSGSGADDIFQAVFDAAAGFAGAPDYNSRMLAVSEQSNTSLMNIYGEQQKTNIILDKIVTAVEDKRTVVKAEPALGKR